MKKLFVLTAFTVFLFVLPSCDSSDSSGDQSFNWETTVAFRTAVDTALNNATNKRGISVAVYKDGYNMWTYAAGYADGTYGTDTGVPMAPSIPTYAYSITKTVVSALVLTQIIDLELYSLDDTVDGLLAGNDDYDGLSSGQKNLINTDATVEELLTHRSGMLDYASNLTDLIPMCDPAHAWVPATIIEEIVFATLATPGEYKYSNTNYILLGMIAEEMGGAPLDELLASTFFDRLGITAVLPPLDAYPSNIAHPYDDQAAFGLPSTFTDFSLAIKWIAPDYDFYLGVGRGTWAAGGIVATAANLAKWGHALYEDDGTAVSDDVRTTLLASAIDPANEDYGYGISYSDFTYDDLTQGGIYGHGGSAPGYRTSLKYETGKDITIAIITNVNNLAGGGAGLVDQNALAKALLNAYTK